MRARRQRSGTLHGVLVAACAVVVFGRGAAAQTATHGAPAEDDADASPRHRHRHHRHDTAPAAPTPAVDLTPVAHEDAAPPAPARPRVDAAPVAREVPPDHPAVSPAAAPGPPVTVPPPPAPTTSASAADAAPMPAAEPEEPPPVFEDEGDDGSPNMSDDLSLTGSGSTAASPRAWSMTFNHRGAFTTHRRLLVRLGASVSYYGATSPPAGSSFASQGGTVFQFNAGTTWKPHENWLFTLDGNFSPVSTTLAPTSVTFAAARPGATPTTVDAQLASASGSAGGGASVYWRFAHGEHSSSSFTLAGNAGLYGSTQALTTFANRNGTTTSAAEVSQLCARTPASCPAWLTNLLAPHPASVVQGQLQLTFSQSIRATTFGVVGAYYLYDRDPDSVGVFGVAAFGRSTAQFGAGAPVAATRWSVEADVAYTFNDSWYLSGSVAYAAYTTAGSFSIVANARLDWYFRDHWSAALSLTGQRDVDVGGEALGSLTTLLALRRGF